MESAEGGSGVALLGKVTLTTKRSDVDGDTPNRRYASAI
jgi:hypothetical protein